MASLSSKNAIAKGNSGSRGKQKLTDTKKEVLSDLPGMLFQAWLPLHGEGKRLLDLVDLVDLPSETLSIVHPINDQRRVGHTGRSGNHSESLGGFRYASDENILVLWDFASWKILPSGYD